MGIEVEAVEHRRTFYATYEKPAADGSGLEEVPYGELGDMGATGRLIPEEIRTGNDDPADDRLAVDVPLVQVGQTNEVSAEVTFPAKGFWRFVFTDEDDVVYHSESFWIRDERAA